MSEIKFPLFFTKTGTPAEKRNLAYYCIDAVAGEAGVYKITRRGTRGPWKSLGQGSLSDVNRIYLEIIQKESSIPAPKKPIYVAADVEEALVPVAAEIAVVTETETPEVKDLAVTEDAGTATPIAYAPRGIVASVLSRIKDHTDLTERELSDYLWTCLERNRMSDKKCVVHTRLHDKFGQPIYITAHERGDNEISCLQNSRIVDTIASVKYYEPACTDAVMPSPIQWSYSVSDYVWDPTLPVAPITDFSYDHMVRGRSGRIRDDIPHMSEEELLYAIKTSLAIGVERAAVDCTYAIPTYSRKRNSVNMLLPLYIPQYSLKEPVAAILLFKGHLGYTPATILTCRMAYLSAVAFRDPANTWLKECKL